jgi:hypothetical protein
MSAIRLHRAEGLGIEIRVDDETPQGNEPVMILLERRHICARPRSVVPDDAVGVANLSIVDAEKVRDALTRAIDDARMWKADE